MKSARFHRILSLLPALLTLDSYRRVVLDVRTYAAAAPVVDATLKQPTTRAATAAWNALGETQELGAGITPGICVDRAGTIHVVYMGGGKIFYRRNDEAARQSTRWSRGAPAAVAERAAARASHPHETSGFDPAEEVPVPEGPANYNSPHLVCDNQGTVHLTFERDFTRFSKKSWYTNRRDGKWKRPVLVLDHSATEKRVNYPRLAVHGDEVFIGGFVGGGSTIVRLLNVSEQPTVAGSVDTPLWVAHPLVDAQGQLWVVGRDGPRGHLLERYSGELRRLGERLLLSRGTPGKTGEPTAAIIDENGVVHVAGVTRSAPQSPTEVLWYSTSARAAAGKDVILGPELGKDVGEDVYPVLARDAYGRIHVSYRHVETGEARLSILDERAGQFAPPVTVAPGVHKRSRWNPHLAAAPGGGVYIVWDNDGRIYFRPVGGFQGAVLGVGP
ncbi:MAG: hypothetical protein ACREH8_20035 [Opitutaceae bacterium]